MTPELCAWAAGIMDGEGYIGVYGTFERGRRHLNLHVGVNNTDLRMLRRLYDNFGGTKIKLNATKAVRPLSKKPLYTWVTYGRKAEPFLRAILPYLVCKKEQADVALLFIETLQPQGPGIKNETDAQTLALRQEMYASLRALKTEVHT